MSIKFRWLGYVCFEMVLPSGKVLIIDPFIDYSETAPIKCKEVTGADYIAITHGHFDHITDVGPLVKKFNSTVICSRQIAEPLTRLFNLDFHDVIEVTAGDNVVFDDLRIEVKQGKHINLARRMRERYEHITGKKAGPDMSMQEMRKAIQSSHAPELNEMMKKIGAAGLSGGEQLNYVLQASDNQQLYIYSSGTYEFLCHEVMQSRPNVFFPQLGGCDLKEVAEISALSGAEIVIPTHHDGDGIEAMHKSVQELSKHLASRSKAQVIDIEHGKWYELGIKVTPV